MIRRPKTVKSMNKVWNKLMEYVSQEDHQDHREPIVSKAFNTMLEDLFCDDFFGTEGQNDPRGDHRD